MKKSREFHPISLILVVFLILVGLVPSINAQQKDMPEVTIATAVSNMAFAAVWVAEQLKYFEQEGVRVKITNAGGGATCQAAAVGRSVNFCASTSEGQVLAHVEGAPLVAIQGHNRNLTLSVVVRKEIAEKHKLTRQSPIAARLKLLSQLGPIGATSPGAPPAASRALSSSEGARATTLLRQKIRRTAARSAASKVSRPGAGTTTTLAP